MSKYSFEFKLEVVKEYMRGETGGYKAIAKKYDVRNHGLLRYWVNDYEMYGEKFTLIKQLKNEITEYITGIITKEGSFIDFTKSI